MVCKRVTNHDALFFFVSHAATRNNGQAANHYALFDMREHLARKTSILIRNNRNVVVQVALPENLRASNLAAVVCTNVKSSTRVTYGTVLLTRAANYRYRS